jgi:hypothetical protein
VTSRLWNTVIWLGASGLAAVSGMAIAQLLSMALYPLWFIAPVFATLILFALLLGGPAAILVTGIRKRRLDMIVGPLILIPIVAIWMRVSDWNEVRTMAKQVTALEMRTFAGPEAPHHLIALEYGSSTACDHLCQLILVNSDYTVAVGGMDYTRTVYRKIGHAECLKTQYVRHNIRFFGICATADPVQRIDDGLLIETPANLEATDLFSKLGTEFDGTAFALVERRGGQDRLLGRWISGKVKSGWFESDSIGQDFTREAFYRAALGMRLDIEDLQNATWLWEGEAAD